MTHLACYVLAYQLIRTGDLIARVADYVGFLPGEVNRRSREIDRREKSQEIAIVGEVGVGLACDRVSAGKCCFHVKISR